MFLSRLIRARRDDRGGALIGVIALLGITSVIAVTVGTVSVNSLKTTNAVVASVEARGAADAGVNAAELAMRSASGCPAGGVITRAAAPAYTVRIQHDVGAGWVNGCPPPQATQVRFLSEGSAARGTFAGANNGSKLTIEAVYRYVPEYVEIPVVDPAVYAYSIDGVLKKFVLDSADISIAADLQIKTGDFECSNNARVSGDVILGDGYANLNMCQILGTLHATKYATLLKSEVTGDLIASGVGVGATADAVNLTATSEVDGSVFAGGNVSVADSLIRGNVTAAKDASTKVVLGSGGAVAGNVLTTGTISGAGTVGGNKTGAFTSLTPPPSAQVPNWTNIPYKDITVLNFPSTTWFQQGFINRVVWTGDCTLGNNSVRWGALAALVIPTVIDATACVGGVKTLNNLSPDIQLQTDVVFIADKFQFDKLYFESNNPSIKRDVYFIVPDNNPNLLPSCEGEAGDIYITNEANIKASVSAFAYTPCKIKSDRDGWRGQFYGGEVEFNQQAQMTFVPTTPPGIDFSGGVPPQLVLDSAFLGDRISIREVASGG